ncbi:MAG: RNA polymerase sigma-70 factor [Marinifilaceae bacterium]
MSCEKVNIEHYWNAIKQGDKQSFEHLFQHYYLKLCIYAEQLLKDKNVAEDVVQNTFIALWTKRDEIVISGSLKSYLFRMVYNAALNHIEKERKNIGMDTISVSAPVLCENWIEDFMDNESDLFMLSQINKAINALPEQTKQIFMLARVEGKKAHEIALILDISVRTVENHLYRSLKRLKAELAHLEDGRILLYLFSSTNY